MGTHIASMTSGNPLWEIRRGSSLVTLAQNPTKTMFPRSITRVRGQTVRGKDMVCIEPVLYIVLNNWILDLNAFLFTEPVTNILHLKSQVCYEIRLIWQLMSTRLALWCVLLLFGAGRLNPSPHLTPNPNPTPNPTSHPHPHPYPWTK